MFRSATGVLNTMHLSEVAGVNARLFEAAGCGAAVLTDFRPTIPDLFAVGTRCWSSMTSTAWWTRRSGCLRRPA